MIKLTLSNEMQRKLRPYRQKINNYLAGAAVAGAILAASAIAYNTSSYVRRCADYAGDLAKFSFCKDASYVMKKGETIDQKLYEEGFTNHQIDAARQSLTLRNFFFGNYDHFDVNKIRAGQEFLGIDYNKDGKFGK